VPVPALLFWSLPVAPLALYASNPALWGQNGIAIVRFVLAPLAPTIARTDYAGATVSALPVPGGFAASFVFRTLPVALSVATLAGALLVAHHLLARRFASGASRPPPDRQAVGALLVVGLGATLIGPALAPAVFTTFPPRIELALPFVAALGAFALGRIRDAARPLHAGLMLGGTLAGFAWLALARPGTLSAFFDPMLGGTRLVMASRALPVGDGSELGVLAAAIDRQGRSELPLHAPGVPPELWDVLRKAGRLRTFVVTAPAAGPGSLRLARGKASGEVVAVVERGGATLWTLAR
jgi:hypothetical protein